jgi:hypothetical protein
VIGIWNLWFPETSNLCSRRESRAKASKAGGLGVTPTSTLGPFFVEFRVSWSRRFEEPILLPDGRKLRTLREAINWLAKEVPKSEHKMEKVQNAAHLVTRAAEHGGPMIFAQMGMLQAIHRHHKRVFNPDRKDPHWGRRKLKQDQ